MENTNSTTGRIASALAADFIGDAAVTRRVLERVPAEKFDWTPHEKSMPFGRLAGHIAELQGFPVMIMKEDGLDLPSANTSHLSRRRMRNCSSSSMKRSRQAKRRSLRCRMRICTRIGRFGAARRSFSRCRRSEPSERWSRATAYIIGGS